MKLKSVIVIGWLCGVIFAQSPILFAQSRADCLACHSDSSLAKEREGKQVSLYVNESILNNSPHKKLVCSACHSGFSAENIPHKEKITPVNCLNCHNDVAFKHEFHPKLAKALNQHQEPDVGCKDCHGTHDIISPKNVSSKFHESNLVESCGECHGDVKEKFSASAHGQVLRDRVKGAPNCLTCHRHTITGVVTSQQDSVTRKIAQEKLCLSCHLDNPDVRTRTSPASGFIAAYEKSVHGAALLRGNPNAANCVDCHGSHEMNKGSQATSHVNKKNTPETCGKCHSEIAKEFQKSIHGVVLAKGNSDAPGCTSCHGEHNIFLHTDDRSPIAMANVAKQCASCHGSAKLSQKYGIAGNRTETFADTYHGLAMQGGSVNVANCASCHGAHNIKPSSDSTSTISKGHLSTTCGKCHPGANEKFAVGAVHVQMTAKEEPTLYWISTVYIIMIIVVVGGMALHNILDFIKKSRRKLLIRRGVILEEHTGHSLYVRMTLNERLQHGTLLISFMLLVVTGFMLRYPDAWWVAGIRHLNARVFDLRSMIHRVSAVLMVGASLYHLYYLLFTARGKQLFLDLLPVAKDITDAIAVMKYNTGFSSIKPKFHRFSYIEKSEYWALVWGTAVMAGTGAIMWFDNTFIGIFTKLGYDISRTIHFYEAWLATLAIIVWHLYYVIFNPDTYPINLAFLKGTITEAEMEEEHALELEAIRRQRLEKENSSEETWQPKEPLLSDSIQKK
jgi:cytochrome b subunit of formate dehydrogenase